MARNGQRVTQPGGHQASALGGFVVRRTAGGWQLEHEDAGYLMPLTFAEVRAFIAGRYDTGELLRGQLVEVGDYGPQAPAKHR